ncbi:LOW QUALITY PROTEIN: transcription factor HES-4 [Erethizon dorsatum]
MPAHPARKPSASPMGGAPARAGRTPDKTRSAAEPCKSSKPVTEKRCARTNESLAQLKTLILDSLRKDSSRHSKLEKADILEMTVRHLHNPRHVQVTAALGPDPAVLGKYRAGFTQRLARVSRFLTCEGVPADVRSRLLRHLAAGLSRLRRSWTAPAPAAPRAPAVPKSGPQGRSGPWRPWLRCAVPSPRARA